MAVVKDEVNFRVNLSYGETYIHDDSSSSEEVREGLYFQFIFWGILVPFIASFGFVGNTLTMIVLFRKEMRSTTIYYLRALVVTDSIILLVVVAVLTPFSIAEISHDFKYYKDVVYPLIFSYLNFAVMAVQTCNVWITVSVSVERYIAICHPFVAPRITRKSTTLLVIAGVVSFSIFYNLPRVFSTTTRPCDKVPEDCYVLYSTDFGTTYGYKIVFHVWMYVIVMFVIPLLSLIVLNILIILELMRMARRRRGTNIQNDDEANLSLVLVLIVVVFIICQTPGLIAQFEIFTFPVFLKLVAVSNTLVVLNSSVNFLIYTFVGRRFRKVLMKRVFYKCVKEGSLGFNHITSSTHYELARVDNV